MTGAAETLEFLPTIFLVHSYPVASQLADKVCAMYERHVATPPERASTRYHDFYDIVLIASGLPVSAAELSSALDTLCRVRSINPDVRSDSAEQDAIAWLAEKGCS